MLKKILESTCDVILKYDNYMGNYDILDKIIGWKFAGHFTFPSPFMCCNLLLETKEDSMWLNSFGIAILISGYDYMVYVDYKCPDIYQISEFSDILNIIKKGFEKYNKETMINSELSFNNISTDLNTLNEYKPNTEISSTNPYPYYSNHLYTPTLPTSIDLGRTWVDC